MRCLKRRRDGSGDGQAGRDMRPDISWWRERRTSFATPEEWYDYVLTEIREEIKTMMETEFDDDKRVDNGSELAMCLLIHAGAFWLQCHRSTERVKATDRWSVAMIWGIKPRKGDKEWGQGASKWCCGRNTRGRGDWKSERGNKRKKVGKNGKLGGTNGIGRSRGRGQERRAGNKEEMFSMYENSRRWPHVPVLPNQATGLWTSGVTWHL